METNPAAEKIVDVMQRVRKDGGTCVSVEFFPARTAAGVTALLRRVDETVLLLRPNFISLTWRAQFKDPDLWLSIGSQIQSKHRVPVLMHLTCHRPVVDLKRILDRCRQHGLRNILAVRGDPPVGASSWRPAPGCLLHAQELVELIRSQHGDFFCVAVAGYPEVHLESHNSPSLPPSEQARELDLERLRAKCAAGADFIVTQFCYDAGLLLQFVGAVRALGVALPVVPGYMPVQTFEGARVAGLGRGSQERTPRTRVVSSLFIIAYSLLRLLRGGSSFRFFKVCLAPVVLPDCFRNLPRFFLWQVHVVVPNPRPAACPQGPGRPQGRRRCCKGLRRAAGSRDNSRAASWGCPGSPLLHAQHGGVCPGTSTA